MRTHLLSEIQELIDFHKKKAPNIDQQETQPLIKSFTFKFSPELLKEGDYLYLSILSKNSGMIKLKVKMDYITINSLVKINDDLT